MLCGGDEAGKWARLVSGSSGGDAGECGLQAEWGERSARDAARARLGRAGVSAGREELGQGFGLGFPGKVGLGLG